MVTDDAIISSTNLPETTDHSIPQRVHAVVGTSKSPKKFPKSKIDLLSTCFVNPPPYQYNFETMLYMHKELTIGHNYVIVN